MRYRGGALDDEVPALCQLTLGDNGLAGRDAQRTEKVSDLAQLCFVQPGAEWSAA
jgi:hypothetical protein